MTLMENFRDFQLGPDPFGRTWHVLFKYLQTGISIRHSDSVDVCFVLENGEEKLQTVIVLHHADLRGVCEAHGPPDKRYVVLAPGRLQAALCDRNRGRYREGIPARHPAGDCRSTMRRYRSGKKQWVKTHAA